MNLIMLETSQMLEGHPLLEAKENYKIKYLNVLEYFTQKYSADDPWATQTLQLYIKKFLGADNGYKYSNFELQHDVKPVLAKKFRPFKFFLIVTVWFLIVFLSVHMGIRIRAKRFFLNYHLFIINGIKRKFDGFLILCLIPLFLLKELNRFTI